MGAELLSICIPTRNRAKYLRELLAQFATQTEQGEIGEDLVAFYISDNASVDGTEAVVREFEKKLPHVTYIHNSANIGGDGNILQVRTCGKGDYRWVIGDDELLCERVSETVLGAIKQDKPGLILAYNRHYVLKVPAPQAFDTYREYARECLRFNPHALAEHSLVSCNILRADCYDIELGKKTIETHFAHMFGMVRGLMQRKARVVLLKAPVISVRQSQPGPADGEWVNVDAGWVNYFQWLRDELEMPEIDPNAPVEFARQALINRIKKHPFRFVASNWRRLLEPRAYLFVFNRIFRKTH